MTIYHTDSYSVEAGRHILRNGKNYIIILRHGGTTPVEADEVTQRIAGFLNNSPEYFDSAFLDNLAHQLVSPLQCIENHCVNLVEGVVEEPEEQRKRLKEVIGHTKILIEVANRMRFLHNLVAGDGGGIRLADLPFATVVTKIIDCCNNYLPLLRIKDIDFGVPHKSLNKLPDIVGEPLAIQHIFMNLLDNALKYADPGSSIQASGHTESGRVVLEFTTRSRLGRSEVEAVFERGTRGEDARKLSAGGTGVGLYVCRQLMEAMGGTLSCKTIPEERQTTFIMKWNRA